MYYHYPNLINAYCGPDFVVLILNIFFVWFITCRSSFMTRKPAEKSNERHSFSNARKVTGEGRKLPIPENISVAGLK